MVTTQRNGKTSQSLRGRISRYLPLILWLALISYASSGDFSAANTSRFVGPVLRWLFPDISASQLMVAHVLVRKTAHLVGYAVLAVLAARAFYTSSLRWLQSRWFASSAILLVTYAMIDEYHQSFVPTRTGTVVDVLIDIFGGLVALVLFRLLKTGDRRSKAAAVSQAREVFRAD